nr:TetR/AcrR family transcriptional regulator [Streptomyces sp. SID3343]
MPPPNRLRADAAHNRRALLDAAAAIFAEQGMDASIAEIATRAGIGKGTVFRHFATKERLVAAIFTDQLDELTRTATELLNADDPAAALLTFMATGVEMQTRDRAFCQAATGIIRSSPDIRAARDRLSAAAEALTDRARRAGTIRPDITGEDVVRLLGAACVAATPAVEDVPDLWRRYLHLIFDGLRSTAATVLPLSRLPHPQPHPHPHPHPRPHPSPPGGQGGCVDAS